MSLGLISTLMLAGCQTAPNVQPAASSQEVHNIPTVPFSKGPTSPPNTKGPSAPFPNSGVSDSNGQPQSITETEQQKFTLN